MGGQDPAPWETLGEMNSTWCHKDGFLSGSQQVLHEWGPSQTGVASASPALSQDPEVLTEGLGHPLRDSKRRASQEPSPLSSARASPKISRDQKALPWFSESQAHQLPVLVLICLSFRVGRCVCTAPFSVLPRSAHVHGTQAGDMDQGMSLAPRPKMLCPEAAFPGPTLLPGLALLPQGWHIKGREPFLPRGVF